MSTTQEKVVLGKLGAVYGIKGWLKVVAYTDYAEDIFNYSHWLIGRDDSWQEAEVVEWRRHNKGLIAKLAHVDVREKAQLLTGMEIAVLSEQLPELDEGEFYWRDLVGMAVVNKQGYNMGQVKSLMETGSNDVLVVKANHNDAFGKTERLIPFVESQTIEQVDQEQRVITVDWDADF
ncbi:ribosome maturation factor RimM [Saccharobesus litoralis]|uniref:Ribosome maturation factor RimM n=1 Tax=Saccharobesus litoralis TaxID=2172099 RepID=A0A2S0VUW3_9ALTE|nr:ribosome maturation factor RimM [Saccharobesus litoralis]AWB67973.1 ribosome maturation factor RimM [Saccharobesus litoralis]